MTLLTSLTRLGLDGRLKWWEVERLMDLAQVDVDKIIERLQVYDGTVELEARDRFNFYRKIGGSELNLEVFRAKVRHELITGEHI